MIELTPTLSLDEKELVFDFIRASGPGGQNVNKVSTAVQLRFDVANSPSLPADVKERLIKLAGNRMTEDGILIIEAKRFRSQEKNRIDAVQRLVTLIQKAAEPAKKRKPTRPSVTARAARVGAKRQRGVLKRTRKYNPDEWE
ncbi:MAG: peptide chain release factor I [Chloroflexi bacterium GWB2_54_36]|nr:MAG: peptide chain release factor I [Chloroflexi bacterium GWB2_54_36]HBA92165.1 aminoacyl-tRNA hydrolase [Anaerolineaceae bacterium]